MKLIALMPVRNEAWCIEASMRSALRWCDEIVVYIHSSTDETLAIILALVKEFGERVHYLIDNDPVWREMSHRQSLLNKARKRGATHCAVVDADEILTENLVPSIRQHIEALPPQTVMQPPWITLWRSLDQYRDDSSVWSRVFVSMAFPESPHLCWQLREGGYDHHRRHPFGSNEMIPWRDKTRGGLMHMQHVSWRRVLAKQAWYRAVELTRWPEFGAAQINARYGPTTNEDGIGFSAVPADWWGPEKELIKPDAEPWQEADLRRMIAERGRDYFADLDLLGVA